MPNETYGLIVRAWTTTKSLRVIVVVSYTFTTAPESNITLHPAEVEIEVRNKEKFGLPRAWDDANKYAKSKALSLKFLLQRMMGVRSLPAFFHHHLTTPSPLKDMSPVSHSFALVFIPSIHYRMFSDSTTAHRF
ncbi:hypothetical protein FA13DRAFT_1324313 [Coprinellus micaceus]|uniref:Uncharacterized protein n=1 Tax=Coprinellus micaceus TaxID=71717 RepID=A0A4Y7SRJ8_COPMI|nr:hypothetical protein FA13DRAFT_1324313 [Coprinellus micaceus]